MKFDHRVKFKGVLYEIGQDVPMEENKAVEKANTKPQEVAKEEVADDFSQYMNAPEIEEESTEDRNARKIVYTKTEINRMSTADLKKLAKLNGLDDSLSGAEIKKMLIEAYKL